MKSAPFKKQSFTPLLLLLLTAALALSGCHFGRISPQDTNEDAEANATLGEESTEETEPEQPPVLYYHPLTGVLCEENISTSRPLAICVGNDNGGMPQFGLSCADVLIEAPVENGTRFMALYANHDAVSTIGSIRSTRDWLMSFSNAFGAVAVYNGTTDTVGEDTTHYPSADTVDYTQNANSGIFYKDPSRVSPHNVMVSLQGLKSALQSSSFCLTADPAKMPYQNAENGGEVQINGSFAVSVRAMLSLGTHCEFSYNALTNTYLRRQNGESHTDAFNAKQLEFTNLFILFCNVSSYSSASGTSFTMDTSSGGSGYYITGGKAVNILWSTDDSGTIKFTNTTGAPLTVSCGKSYIGLMKVSEKNNLSIN